MLMRWVELISVCGFMNCLPFLQPKQLLFFNISIQRISVIRVIWGVGAGVTARQNYFTHFEPSQSLVGAKTGDPREKTPGHPQA